MGVLHVNFKSSSCFIGCYMMIVSITYCSCRPNTVTVCRQTRSNTLNSDELLTDDLYANIPYSANNSITIIMPQLSPFWTLSLSLSPFPFPSTPPSFVSLSRCPPEMLTESKHIGMAMLTSLTVLLQEQSVDAAFKAKWPRRLIDVEAR